MALLSGFPAVVEIFTSHPDWLEAVLSEESLGKTRSIEELREEGGTLLRNAGPSALDPLRQFKQRSTIQNAARSLARFGSIEEITREISNVADVCVEAVTRICLREWISKFGQPWHLDSEENWQETDFCVIALGNLGGQEAGYSSEIELLFVYAEEGNVFRAAPRPNEQTGKGMTNHQFFTRLAENLIGELEKQTPDGTLFRVDVRRRPEGKSGTLARSLGSYENYYSEWGQAADRMALAKARPIAGSAELGADFLQMIQSFRYPRWMTSELLREVAAVKSKLEAEPVKEWEQERNVKIGRGGIREFEFVLQALGVLHAGRLPALQVANSLVQLARMERHPLLKRHEREEMAAAITFLREVQHRLQLEGTAPPDVIPTERQARERLARLMGFETVLEFEDAHQSHTNTVHRIFEKTLPVESERRAPALPHGDFDAEAAAWQKLLTRHGFREPAKACEILRTFLFGPEYAPLPPDAAERARQIWIRFLALCPKADGQKAPRVLSDPDRVLARLDFFVYSYRARASLYELWVQTPLLLDLLLWLSDRSEYLAREAIQTPDILDELGLSGRLHHFRGVEESLAELHCGAGEPDQRKWLRSHFQSEAMAIGLRDILGYVDIEENVLEMSSLTEACVQYALEVVIRKHEMTQAPFCIVGCRALAGREVSYGRSIELLFVTDLGEAELPKLNLLANEFIELFSGRGDEDPLVAIQPHLKLVNTMESCEARYRELRLDDVLTIARARPIAGNMETGARFRQLAAEVLKAFQSRNVDAELSQWRERVEREETPPGQERLAIVTGAGGLLDGEILARAASLAHGWDEPNTMRALRRAAKEGVLPAEDATAIWNSYAELRRIESVLCRWSFQGERVLPLDEPAQYRVAVRCGFSSVAEFMKSLKETRAALRSAYLRHFRKGHI